MYLVEIFWLTTWPLTIIASYLLTKWALKKFESNLLEEDK